MQFYKIFLFLLVLLLACASPQSDKETGERTASGRLIFPDGRVANDTLVAISDLTIHRSRTEGNAYYKDDKPYNGSAIDAPEDALGFLEYRIIDAEMVQMFGYYEDGTLERNFTFKQGKSHGTLRTFYENEEKYLEENFNMGKLNGPQFRWHDNGQLWREATYKDGKMLEEKQFNRSGERLK